MTRNEAKQFIEAAIGYPVNDMDDGGFHVRFDELDMLTDEQWATVRVARNDVTDKGVYFYA